MKILFITSSLSAIGGIQRYNKFFINTLRKQGHEVQVLELESQNLFKKAFFLAKFILICITKKTDLVICSHINFSRLGYFASKIFNIKYMITLFGIEARTENITSYAKIFERANRICTVSEYTIEKIVHNMPHLNSKIYFLENPIDGEKFKPLPKNQRLVEQLGLNNKKVILTVSRLSAQEKYKGYDKVLEALSLIRGELPNFIYVIVGDGDDRERIERIAKDLKLENNLLLAGFVGEDLLVDYYNLADVFVMPSKFEGFGFVFLEALACSVPSIAGNIDGSVAPLLNGKIGILVNPENSEQIGCAIRDVILRRARKEVLDKEYIRREVISAYGLDSFEKKVKNLIDEL